MSEPNVIAKHPRVDWSHWLTKRPILSSLKLLLGWIRKICTGCFAEIIEKPYHCVLVVSRSESLPVVQIKTMAKSIKDNNHDPWTGIPLVISTPARLVLFRGTELNKSVWFIWYERCQLSSGVDRQTGTIPQQREVQEIHKNWNQLNHVSLVSDTVLTGWRDQPHGAIVTLFA